MGGMGLRVLRCASAVLLGVVAPLASVSVASAAAKGDGAAKLEQHLSLERYGYRPTTSPVLQREGYTMETLDYIDDEHLLLTFNTKKLIPRMAEDREGDQDRLIRALVLHLPDGKIVHESEWRTHDRNQYLWPLAKGGFLLRVRNELSFVEPMRGREGFERRTLLDAKRDIEVIQVSPGRDMLLVETVPAKQIGDDPAEAEKDPPVQGAFYSVIEGERPSLRLRAVIKEDRPFLTAFTSRGYLSSVKEDRAHWGFDFHPFTGGKMELAGFTSSCQPHADFLSDATFIATGCRGGDDRRLLAGFNLLAEASWVFTTNEPPVWPAVMSSPEAGRFALRTTVLSVVGDPTARISPEEIRGQDVRVFRFRGGEELLRVPIGPAQRPAQNFSLSPDGRRLAILHDSELEVYGLPTPDAEDLKEVEKGAAAVKKIRVPDDAFFEARPEKRVMR